MNLIIQLGYVESTRFHTFLFSYQGPLAENRAQTRKNMPKIIRHLGDTILEYWKEFEPNKGDEDPSVFFDDLVKEDIDSFGMAHSEFFEDRGWYICGSSDTSASYTVVNVARFLDDGTHLDWYGSTGKAYSTLHNDD